MLNQRNADMMMNKQQIPPFIFSKKSVIPFTHFLKCPYACFGIQFLPRVIHGFITKSYLDIIDTITNQ
jgi:hypothetical protein